LKCWTDAIFDDKIAIGTGAWGEDNRMKGKIVAASLALSAIAGPVAAHHSSAMFDQTKTVVLNGTVKQFLWTNPHCYIQLLVKNGQGAVEEWSLEMTAPLHLQRLGWNKSSLKPGEKVTVKIHPLRDGGKGGNVEEAADANGKPIGQPA
jgi:hypothetical protein